MTCPVRSQLFAARKDLWYKALRSEKRSPLSSSTHLTIRRVHLRYAPSPLHQQLYKYCSCRKRNRLLLKKYISGLGWHLIKFTIRHELAPCFSTWRILFSLSKEAKILKLRARQNTNVRFFRLSGRAGSF